MLSRARVLSLIEGLERETARAAVQASWAITRDEEMRIHGYLPKVSSNTCNLGSTELRYKSLSRAIGTACVTQ